MTNQTTIAEIAWVAGWLEGEGSFTSPLRSPRISATNTDLDVLERVCRLLGAAWYPCKTDRRHQTKPLWLFHLCGKNAIAWMLTIYPFMGRRRRSQIRSVIAKWHTQRKPGPKLGSKFGPRKKRRDLIDYDEGARG